uniref:Amidohydrolase-related domain-containing protein n=1 Tax=mine drainage metagenome TaxID=410659 RepID=E6PKA3_9ZZZZ
MPDQASHLDCRWLLASPGSQHALAHRRIQISDGLIQDIAPQEHVDTACRKLVLPALSNAHDHARTFRSASLGAFEQPLESWLPYLGVVPGVDPYLSAATSFARAVRHGVAGLMVHYTRVQGLAPYVDEVEDVARAARDVGVHIGFAVAMRDRQGIAYCSDSDALKALRPEIRDVVAQRLGTHASMDPARQLALVDDVAGMVEQGGYGSHVTVQYGPTGVQWCTAGLLEAIARASSDTGRPVHMHLLETRYQREWADLTHPQGILRDLDAIGMLSPRLTLAHCTWARPDELELLAERGVTIAVNTSSNLGLKSGVAPVAQMLRCGCRVAMGLDGMALDEDDDAFREMRLAYALHRGWGYDTTMTRAQLWAFSAVHGRRVVRGGDKLSEACGGLIAKGAPADLVVLDFEALDDDAFFPDVDPLDLVLARAHGGHIEQVVIDGRPIVHQGKVLTIDEPALRAELMAQVRSRLGTQAELGPWREAVGAMAQDLAVFYRNRAYLGCC